MKKFYWAASATAIAAIAFAASTMSAQPAIADGAVRHRTLRYGGTANADLRENRLRPHASKNL